MIHHFINSVSLLFLLFANESSTENEEFRLIFLKNTKKKERVFNELFVIIRKL